MRIGIDVGGTNTDGVLLHEGRLIASTKQPTTADVSSGIRRALTALMAAPRFSAGQVDAVMIGTTHFLNAITQVQGLTHTAAIRIAVPSKRVIPPMGTWPAQLARALGPHRYICAGGHEYDGRATLPFDEAGFHSIVDRIAEDHVPAVALTATFSPMSADLEEYAAAVLEERIPGLTVCRSHEIGHIGLLGRENATIFNACLVGMANQVFDGVTSMIAELGLTAPVYVSQNDGTVMDVDYARRFPIATFSAGPTNSIRGAGLLSGHSEGVVVDVGGTTSDVGVLRDGFPRTSTDNLGVSGVYTNFRMPELRSLALGGGTKIDWRGGSPRILPATVGGSLRRDAVVFGGDQPTLTDVAVAAGLAPGVGDETKVAHWERARCEQVLADVRARMEQAVSDVRTTIRNPPLIAVGGAAFLVPKELAGTSRVEYPLNHAFANAVGAAMSRAGAELDRLFQGSANAVGRQVKSLEEEVLARAIAAGADPDRVRITYVNLQEQGFYSSEITRVRMRAAGDIRLTRPVLEPA